MVDPGEQLLVRGRGGRGLRHWLRGSPCLRRIRPVSLTAAAPTLRRVRAVLRFVASVMMVSGSLLIADAGVTLLWQEPVSAYFAERSRASWRRPCSTRPRGSSAGSRCRATRSRGSRSRDRRLRVRRRGHRRRQPAQGARPLPRHPAAGRARHVGDRRPPHDLRRPLPAHRRAEAAASGSSSTCPTGASSTGSSARRSWTTRTCRSRQVGYQRLVLSACHPLYSAAQRIMVFARLVRREPARVRRS